MRVLVVYAHPDTDSFTRRMRDALLDGLNEAGHEVQLSDLYAQSFNPTAGPHDFVDAAEDAFFSYYHAQLRAHQAGAFSDEVQSEQAKVSWCDLLVLVFPLWWFSMPAILKGWVDRVFAAGFAYRPDQTFDRAPLWGKRAILAISVGSIETAHGPDSIKGDMDTILFPIHRGILQYTGFQVLAPFVAYAASATDESVKRALLSKLVRLARDAESAEPLPFPHLELYDEAGVLKA